MVGRFVGWSLLVIVSISVLIGIFSADPEDMSGMSALDKMAVAFKGGHSREEIERETAAVLRLFDRELTEENYVSLGDTLVYLQKDIAPHTEFDLMRCMKSIGRGTADNKMGIDAAAAMCAAMIETGQIG